MNDFEEQFNLEMDEEVAEGCYANMAVITHSSSEFVLDFVRLMPGVEKARVKSRIILPPEQAKRLLMSLRENVLNYESSFGNIDIHLTKQDNDNLLPFMPSGEA